MTTMEPSPEQFAEWLRQALKTYYVQYGLALPGFHVEQHKVVIGIVAGEAARLAYAAGADAELEECCEWFRPSCPSYGRELREARRPKPLGLKQQAMAELERFGTPETAAIRRAIESMPDD